MRIQYELDIKIVTIRARTRISPEYMVHAMSFQEDKIGLTFK